MEELAAKSDGLSKTDQMQLDFGLGKAYADLKDHDRSFRHLFAGNAAKRSTVAYDEQATFSASRRSLTRRTTRGRSAAWPPRRSRAAL